MPTWWCRMCGKQIPAEDVRVGREGKQYHSACLANYFPELVEGSSEARTQRRVSRGQRIFLIAALGFVVGGLVGFVANPTGTFAIVGGLLGTVVGGIVGQQTQ